MRQGNGNEVLGANDPRSADVGIVYVSPNDDRKTVLAGILTQEKLGRKHIALVLPNQNKAFQRPVDFDDLKGLRRKLQAQLVLIAPVNSAPAELARQRRFTVYSSLENFASAVRSEAPQAEPKRGNGVRGLFGSARYKAALGQNSEATGRTANEQPVSPNDSMRSRRTSQALASREEEHEEDHSISNALAGAAILGAAEAARREPVNRNTSGIMPDADSDEENVDGVDAMGFPGVQDAPRGGEDESLPPPSGSETASRTGSRPSRAGVDPARTDPAPIDLKPARGRVHDTAKLPPENAPASRRGGSGRRRDNDKAAAVVGAGAALGAAALAQKTASGTAAKSSVPTKTRGTGGGGGSRGGVAGGRPPGGDRRRLLLGIALIAAVLLIVLGAVVGLAYANPNAFGPLQSILPRGLPPATITITPASKTISNSYVILAVPNGQTNVNQRQVAARPLTSQQSTSKQINATGHTQVPAAAAHGTLVFENGSLNAVTVNAGTTFQTSNGASIATDTAVTIPAANTGAGTLGVASVAAHATAAGAGGNIGSLAVDQACCTSGTSVTVRNNNAFVGGQDAKNYSFVQEGDVNAFVNSAAQQLTNQANSALRNQLKPGEQLAQATNCPSTTTHSNPIGDQGVNVTSSTITVSVTCSAVAYDANGMQGLVSQLLQKQAASSAGPNYTLDGKIAVQSQVQQVNPDKTVSLVVTAKGLWVYQFSNQQKQQLAKLVAGKSINAAKSILQAQPGVRSVTISSNNATLPTDPSQIAINVQLPGGLQGSGTPTPFPTPPASNPGTAPPQPGRG
jgi:hypothetical protein